MSTAPEVSRKIRQLENDVLSIYEKLTEIGLTQVRHGNRFNELAETQDQHTLTLTALAETQGRHTATLAEHGATLAEHGATLAEHGAKLDRIIELLEGR